MFSLGDEDEDDFEVFSESSISNINKTNETHAESSFPSIPVISDAKEEKNYSNDEYLTKVKEYFGFLAHNTLGEDQEMNLFSFLRSYYPTYGIPDYMRPFFYRIVCREVIFPRNDTDSSFLRVLRY